MDDLISRQAAINTVLIIRQRCDTNDIDEYRDILVECFEVLPAVEPRKGKWKEVQVVIGRDGCFTTKEYECETCGYQQLRHENFCGRCGADMRGE